MRAWEKKKLYRLMIKRQVQRGLMNIAEGAWISNPGSSAGRHLAAGHRVGKR